jgi:hypothetical protein
MVKTFLQVAPVSGQWYVSERVTPDPTSRQLVRPAQPLADRSPSAMILAGPFETRDQAKDWNTLAKASGYIWEKG